MDFTTAKSLGYYFDRCIDLDFYNTDMEHIASLRTPKRGLKPTITIKGLFIEGGYAIDSYISIQNMAFDIDVSYIGYIKARMYYSGLEENTSDTVIGRKVKQGHTVMYRVLYADQEKEPPNRCVRFQCVVASKDTTMYDTPLYISGGELNYLKPGTLPKRDILSSKSKCGATLKKVCEDLIKLYNKSAKERVGEENMVLYNSIRINTLEIDEPLENVTVLLGFGNYKLGDYIRLLNSHNTGTDVDGFTYSKFKIVIDRGVMRVTTPIPSNWKKIAIAKKGPQVNLSEYFNETYLSTKTKVYTVTDGALTPQAKCPVVPLNFVKSATRSECLIYVETLFDDRITLGCDASIKSNAIMGKKFGSSKSKSGGSRILNYLDNEEPIQFRVTGKIEYQFSTTEDSYMKLQGPVDDSIEAKTWLSTAIKENQEIKEKYM